MSSMVTETDRFKNAAVHRVTEPSHYLGVPDSTFRTWAKGYVRRSADRHDVRGEPIVTTVAGQPPRERRQSPSSAWLKAWFLQPSAAPACRCSASGLLLTCCGKNVGIDHVLASKSPYTDGAELLYDFAEQSGDSLEAASALEPGPFLYAVHATRLGRLPLA